jgi:hypothetical protein
MTETRDGTWLLGGHGRARLRVFRRDDMFGEEREQLLFGER